MKRLVIFLVIFVAVGAAGYFWIQNNKSEEAKAPAPQAVQAEDIKFSSVQEQGRDPELKNELDYKVSGNQISILANYGNAVGNCPDKTVSVKHSSNDLFIHIRTTDGRTKDASQSILNVNIPGSAEGKTIKVSKTTDCDEK